MLNFPLLFTKAAFAADTAKQTYSGDSSLMRFLPLFLIFAVFYFLLIRPQQKKIDEHEKMIKALKKGDKVITGGGIVGSVVKLDDESHVTVEIADGVRVKVVRATISDVVKEKTANENQQPSGETKN